MRQYLLMIIAGLVALIMALFTIPYQGTGYRIQGTEGMNLCVPQTDNNVANPIKTHGCASLQQIAHAVDSTTFLPATRVSQTAPDPYFAPAPLPLLSPDAMTEVLPSQLPPLDAGMVNVTGHVAGYRVETQGRSSLQTPNGFAIAVPYDPTLLPQGFTEDEIQTYVYDKQYHRWVAIQRDSVNMEELLVCSRFRPLEKSLPGSQEDMSNPQDVLAQVQGMMSMSAQGDGGGDSPLDFINAVLKTPEMPETSAYTPTSIKKLKAADPLEGLTLMQPPTANNSGTANMSYPIEIPAGRQGMQPNLALTYSSGGGNGWLGVGWDISIPSITVETRWGVPRYDSQKESEVYVYEGEQLVTYDSAVGDFRKLPHRTNQWTYRYELDQDGYEQFWPRKNEVFDSIVRHGSGPNNYWWSVTHKNGVTDYYGGYALDSSVNNNCVLRTGDNNTSGAIAHWALAESVDPYGNSVRYYYEVDIDNGDINKGKQIYLKDIYYTCFDSTEQGKYRVHFVNAYNQRADMIVSANRGFKEKSRGLLDRIEVLYDGILIKTYYFHTINERRSNFKTRLEDIVTVYGDCALPMLVPEGEKKDSLTDYSCIEEGNTNGCQLVRYKFEYFDYPDADDLYTAQDTMTLISDNIQYHCVQNTFHSTALGASKSKSWSLGATGAVGLGPDVSTTLVTLGFNGSYANSKSEGLLTLVDVDGDGLADKLFKIGNKIYYRKQIWTDDRHFTYGDIHELTGINDFLKETSDNGNFGLQVSAGASASFGVPLTWMSVTDYLADINGDGLVDVVTEGGARFNRLNSNGVPSFTSVNSIATSISGQSGDPQTYISNQSLGNGDCGGFIYDGEVDPDIACVYEYMDVTIAAEDFPSYNPGAFASYIVIGMITHTDSSLIHTDTLNNGGNTIISGVEGVVVDSLILRQFSEKDPNCTPESNYPDLDAVRVWIAPREGDITIYSAVQLLSDSSESAAQSRYADGVIYSIEHNHHCYLSGNTVHTYSSYPYRKAGVIGARNDTIQYDTVQRYVYQDDIVFFRLQSNNNRSMDKVKWSQIIEYSNPTHLDDVYSLDKDVFLSDSEFVLVGNNVFQAPKKGTVEISGSLYANDIMSPVELYILRNDTDVLYSYYIPYYQNVSDSDVSLIVDVDSLDNITFEIRKSNANDFNPVWSRIHYKPFLRYYADNQPGDLYAFTDTLSYFPQVRMDIDHGTETPLRQFYHTLFGELYRGWGQFAYNNHDSLGVSGSCIDSCIDICQLRAPYFFTVTSQSQIDTNDFYISGQIDTNDLQGSMTAAVNAVYSPVSTLSRWVEMTAYGQYDAYIGHGLDAAVSASGMDNTPPVVLIPVQDSVAGSLVYDSSVELEQIQVYDHPVPVSITGAPVQTIRKRHRTKTFDGSVSIDLIVASVGSSQSSGNNFVQSDYMDLNGDRYPDPVSTGGVQYSMPWGGIGTLCPIPFYDNDHVSASEVTSHGETYGRCYPIPSRQLGNDPKLSKMTISAGGTNSESEVSSTDNTDYMLIDVNGDGLPDLVNTKTSEGQSCIVSLNTGYGFLDGERWGINFIRNGSSTILGSSSGLQGGFSQNGTTSSGESYSVAQCSIGGGTGLTETSSETTCQLMDVNGDGLPDKVEKSGSGINIRYNLGNGLWSGYETVNDIAINKSASYSEDVNVGVTAGFTLLAILKINVGVQTSPKNHGFNTDCAQLVDINGDGYPDYVTSDREDRMYVRYNTAGKTNLLRKVTNFTGSIVELDYQLSKPCFEKPQRSWTLTEVRGIVPPVSAGSANTTFATFEYRNPHYDRYERLEYGYDTVITREHNTIDNDLVYRQYITGYNNVNFFKRGRKISETILDGNDNPYIEHLDQAVLYDFFGMEVSDSICEAIGVYVGREVEATYYYEGQTPYSVVTAVSKEYDNKRNIVKYIHEGIVNGLCQECFTADISYKHNMPHNFISLPDTIVVRDTVGHILRKRTALYDNYGRLVYLQQHNNGTFDADYYYVYDNYGNISRIICPENHSGQRVEYEYSYDTIIHNYPVRVENNSLGYYSTSDYDYRFGKPIKTVDINGSEIRHHYDEMGRDTMVLAPKELADSVPFTIRMSYYPYNFNALASDVFEPLFNPLQEPMKTSYAVTEHYDCWHADDPIVTVLLSDGWGRSVQVKKDADIQGTAVTLVSGNVIYDCFGRVEKQYYPFSTLPMDSLNIGIYHISSNLPFTTTEYDLMDRKLKIKLPTNDSTTYAYNFGTLDGQTYFKTAVTDALDNKITTLSGSLGQKLKIIMLENTITIFRYDALGQLLSSTDPDGFVTSYHYDQLGRMTLRTHPDAGVDKYCYDPAGNMTKHINGKGDTIHCNYHYNQLVDVTNSAYSANNVHYTYGAMGDTNNCAGRIAVVEDASGWQKFEYGKLGEVTKNIRTFALPYETRPFTFAMEYEYDSYNRIQRMTYPDGEEVSYHYDYGGMLKSVTGVKNGVSYKYIDSIQYNKFEQKSAVYYGNGTKAFYKYDVLQRLVNLESYTAISSPGGAEKMQDIAYSYDAVSNIKYVVNTASTLSNGLGGVYQDHYVYDALYRLDEADGYWQGSSNLTYDLDMDYSDNGRVTAKELSAGTLSNGISTSVYYNRDYEYNNSAQPNTLSEIIGSENHYFQWDATGNMVYHVNDRTQIERFLCWEAENRLQGVKDDDYLSLYQYDANGERTCKLTGQGYIQNINGMQTRRYVLTGTTLYASPYLVATPKGYTKHYYAESERIASRIGGGGLHDLDSSIVDDTMLGKKLSRNGRHFSEMARSCLGVSEMSSKSVLQQLFGWRDSVQAETDCYWYHPDHLGSSSWITHTKGFAVQHLHYLPWGEDFVDQRSAHWNAMYTFSAKEKDSETGLSYFGSRYYSSDLSIWLSVDPMSDKYPSTSPYAYCRNNPIVLIDPNGCDDYWISQKGKIHKHKHTNANRDRFFWGKIQYNDKGQITNNFVSIAKSNYNEKSFEEKSGVIKDQPYYRYDFRNTSDAQQVYDFIQSNNPENEWANINIVTSDASFGILTSGGQKKLEPGSSAVFDEFRRKYKNGSFIIWESHRHNHPSGNPPSEKDYETAKTVREYSPDAKFLLDRYKKESIIY